MITALLPEVLKLVPWIGMIAAALIAFFVRQKAQVKTAQADQKVAAANMMVADNANATAQANTQVAEQATAAVVTANQVAAEVAATPADQVRQELQNEFGRKDN